MNRKGNGRKTRYQIIYWRDIPVQVRVRNGRTRLTALLSPRFQNTVYRAAYRAKAITGDAYMQAWRPSDWREREGEPQAVLQAVLAEVEAAYSEQRLESLARSKGYDG